MATDTYLARTPTTQAAAVDYLDARQSDGHGIYRDAATAELWVSTDEELGLLGIAVLDCEPDAYSSWCSDVSAIEVCLDNLVREWCLDGNSDLDATMATAKAGGHTGDYMALRHFRDDVITVIGLHADAAAWDAVA